MHKLCMSCRQRARQSHVTGYRRLRQHFKVWQSSDIWDRRCQQKWYIHKDITSSLSSVDASGGMRSAGVACSCSLQYHFVNVAVIRTLRVSTYCRCSPQMSELLTFEQSAVCPVLRALHLDCHCGHLMKFYPTPWIREPLLLTACSRVLLEKLTGSQRVNKLPAFHATRRFITAT